MGRKTKYQIGTDKVKAERKEKKALKEAEAPIVAGGVAEPAKEVTQAAQTSAVEEQIKKLSPQALQKMIDDYSKKDPYSLKGLNPAFRYRFLNRASEKLDRQTMRGWEIVTGDEADSIAKASKITTRQGQIQVGDGVLAKIPMEMYVAIRAKLQDLNRRTVGENSKSLRRDMGSKYSRNVEETLKVTEKGGREQTVI